MDKHVLFIQGGGEGAYTEDQHIADALVAALGSSWHVHYPAMPREADPDYNEWKKQIHSRLSALSEPVILVGHSLGASIILKYLCDSPAVLPAAVFVIASPVWHDEQDWYWPAAALPANAGSVIPKEVPLFLYQAKDDSVVPVKHVHILSELFPHAHIRIFKDGGHQFEKHISAVAKDILRSVKVNADEY